MTSTPGIVRFSRILAWSALALVVAGPLGVRTALIDFGPGLLACALGVLTGLIALLLAMALTMRGVLAPYRPALRRSMAIALLPVAAGVAMVTPAIGKPVIHDITTDIADPPRFETVLPLRGPHSNALERDADLDAMQRAGYPGLEGIDTPLAPTAAVARAADVARELGWDVHSVDPERGLVEASQTTFWFRFVDDIVIRVRPEGTGSRVDLRSVSRVGKGDLGANARRIGAFIERYRDAG